MGKSRIPMCTCRLEEKSMFIKESLDFCASVSSRNQQYLSKEECLELQYQLQESSTFLKNNQVMLVILFVLNRRNKGSKCLVLNHKFVSPRKETNNCGACRKKIKALFKALIYLSQVWNAHMKGYRTKESLVTRMFSFLLGAH